MWVSRGLGEEAWKETRLGFFPALGGSECLWSPTLALNLYPSLPVSQGLVQTIPPFPRALSLFWFCGSGEDPVFQHLGALALFDFVGRGKDPDALENASSYPEACSARDQINRF